MDKGTSGVKDSDEYLDFSILSLEEGGQTVMCSICSEIGENERAVMVCKEADCGEKLCEGCSKRHQKQKATKNHNIVKIEDDVSVDDLFFCELCTDEAIPGFGYCIECIDPEVLCEKCCKRHTASRRFHNHHISQDLNLLKKMRLDDYSKKDKDFMDNPQLTSCKKNITQETTDKTSDNYPCEPCQFEGKQVSATQFCLDCQDPEPFCYSCGQQHLRQRVGRGHRLSESMQLFKTQQGAVSTKPSPSMDSGAKVEKQPISNYTPGKPLPDIIKSDSVQLHWRKCNDVNCYQMRYKSKDGKENWKLTQTDSNKNEITIEGLMADTTYIFQVRGVKGDIEGPYGQANEEIRTQESLASYLLNFSVEKCKGNPSKFELPFYENPKARNKQYKIRQICLGERKNSNQEEEKTIMLVGATGSGKSTLVDGIVNYVMGVSFEDPFRFTLVKLEDEERRKTGNQAVSQTEWITVYKIPPHKGGRLDFTLNIIDTPGFGDTRGIDRDNAIVDQVRYLFSAKGDERVLFLDSVCFIVKAPDARLTPVQKYIFHAIMSLFGKDIESNICTLITFADGAEPPVLACLKEAKLPYGNTFHFNNSALFATNKNLQRGSLSPFFWEMGCKSFESFFINLKKFETRSLSQTKDVLHEREQLKTIISNLRPQITAGLSKLSELREQLDLFNKHKNDIDDNKDFTYEVEETKQVMTPLPPGQHVTNCLQCNITCHEDCRIADDEEKNRCWAMTDGYCRICSGKCYWDQHRNTPYVFSYRTETVTKTYQEMKERYEKAIGEKLTHEKYLTELAIAVGDLMDDVMDKVDEMNSCKTRLKEIALRPDPLSTNEHIDQMIQGEESERQPGYAKRIKMLQEMRKMALVDKEYENLDQHFRSTRNDITSAVGKEIQPKRTRRQVRRREKQGALAKGINLITKLFG